MANNCNVQPLVVVHKAAFFHVLEFEHCSCTHPVSRARTRSVLFHRWPCIFQKLISIHRPLCMYEIQCSLDSTPHAHTYTYTYTHLHTQLTHTPTLSHPRSRKGQLKLHITPWWCSAFHFLPQV